MKQCVTNQKKKRKCSISRWNYFIIETNRFSNPPIPTSPIHVTIPLSLHLVFLLLPSIQADHTMKKKKICDKWEELRPLLHTVMLASDFSASFHCGLCSYHVEAIIRCQSCGPRAFFCESCWIQHHRLIVLHQPEIWDQQVRESAYLQISLQV